VIVYFIMMLFWVLVWIAFKPENVLVENESYYVTSGRRRDKAIIIMGFILFMVMAFRGVEVGTDTIGYAREYNLLSSYNITSLKFDITKEVGYTFLCWLFNRLHFSWQLYLVAISLFEAYAFSRFIKKFCNNALLGFYLHVTIGFFAMSLTGMRQSIAVALVLLATEACIDKKRLKYIAYILAAITIHYSTIVMIPLFLVFMIKYKSKIQLTIFLVIPFIVRILGSYLYPVIERFALNKYSFSGYFTSINYKLNLAPELVAILILLACYFCIMIKKNDKINNKDLQFFLLTSIYVSCWELSHVVYMAARLNLFFVFYMIVLMINLICDLKEFRVRVFAFAAVLVFPMIQFLMTIPDSSYGIVPYVFFWSR